MAEARAAVAVVSFREPELLAACLRSLEPDARSGLAEVWVVDNASGDGSSEMVSEKFPWAWLVALEENVGYGPAVNLVAERSSAPWLVAANQDVEVEPGALERLVTAGETQPRAGAVTPRLVGADGRQEDSVQPFPTVGVTLAHNLGLHRLSPRLARRLCLEDGWDRDRAGEVPWSFATFLALRRQALEAVGGFDPGQWLHAEDLDLGWRLRGAGWATLYEPGAVVRHAGSVATRKAFGEEVERRYMAASYAWMARRRGMANARAVAAINVAGESLRWLLTRGDAAAHHRRWAGVHAVGLGPRDRLLGRY
jgi:N-acetylglucosaminyl-diphospho-decaprenol L-rhamnosyltransferase